MRTLEEVLAAHQYRESTAAKAAHCSCGTWLLGASAITHRAHLAVEIREWLAEALVSAPVFAAVARAIHGNTIGDPARGESMVRVERKSEDIIWDATVALAAVSECLTGDATGATDEGDVQ